MKTIPQQTQVLRDSCAMACISMLTGIPERQLIDKYHLLYQRRAVTTSEILSELGIPHEEMHAEQGIDEGAVFMAIVPSMVMPQGTHMIIIDTRLSGYVRVIDPAKDFTDDNYRCPHYIWPEQERDSGVAFPVRGFCPVVRIDDVSWH